MLSQKGLMKKKETWNVEREDRRKRRDKKNDKPRVF